MDAGISFQEKLVATIPPDLFIVSNDDIVFSPDGRSVAYAAERDRRKEAVVVNNTRQPEYDWVYGPTFSPDGKKVAYVAVKEIDWKRWLDPNTPNFERGGKWFVVDNGREIGPYDNAELVSYSPDGGRTAFGAMSGNKWFIVAGEKAGEQFDWVGVPVFSSTGQIAYLAQLGKRWLVVKETQKGPNYDGVSNPVWSRDGERLAYAAKKGSKWRVVTDNTITIGEFEAVQYLQFRGDGTPAFVGYRKSRAFVVVGSKEFEAGEDVMSLCFSEDGGTMAYESKVKGSWYIVSGPKKTGPFKNFVGIAISPDGKRVAYSSYDGVWRFVLDDATVHQSSDMASGVRFSKDGAHVAYVLLGDEDKSPGIDGKEVGRFDDVKSPVFSPDGKKVAFGVRAGNELWWKVVMLDKD